MEDKAETRQSLAIPIPGYSSGKSKDRELVGSSDSRFPVLKSWVAQTAANRDFALVGDRLRLSHRAVSVVRRSDTPAQEATPGQLTGRSQDGCRHLCSGNVRPSRPGGSVKRLPDKNLRPASCCPSGMDWGTIRQFRQTGKVWTALHKKGDRPLTHCDTKVDWHIQ